MVVPSLKYLCFEKVIQEVKAENYKVLPTSLLRDINLIKKFNGNYACSEAHESQVLTILYNGNNWNFKLHTLRYGDNYQMDDNQGDPCCCINCRDLFLDSQFIEATVSEGKIVPAFSRIQTLLSLQEFDIRLEVEDETDDGSRALVFHGKENGGTRTCTVRLSVDSHGEIYSTMPDWPDWYFPTKGS